MRKTIPQMYEKARHLAIIKGRPEDAEDFASWITIKYIEGKRLHQYLSHSWVDYLRETYVDRHQQKAGVMIFRVPESNISSTTEINDNEMLIKNIIENIKVSHLTERTIRIIRMKFVVNMKNKDIAAFFKISESRISQIITKSLKSIREWNEHTERNL